MSLSSDQAIWSLDNGNLPNWIKLHNPKYIVKSDFSGLWSLSFVIYYDAFAAGYRDRISLKKF